MATFEECLAALPAFRNDLSRQQAFAAPSSETMTAFNARGAFAAFATPYTNIHATGVGIRQRGGEYDPDEYVIKVFVFDKLEGEVPDIPKTFENDKIGVDVEFMPIQIVRSAKAKHPGKRANKEKTKSQEDDTAQTNALTAAAAVQPEAALPPQRDRRRPIQGGISISPLNANYVGTLGCFLRRRNVDTEEIFVLSNNHVLANVDRLPIGTPIAQPGPETPPFLTSPADAFAALHTVIPIQFPTGANFPAVLNRFDAAIANVTNGDLIERGSMFMIPNYDPSRVVNPIPKMRVIKMGRTTGLTRGTIVATNVGDVLVNYGTKQFPRIAAFRNVIRIVGDGGQPFSSPGDSGSVILEEATGHPVALLFAGDGLRTTACDLGSLCQQLGAFPI